MGGTGVEVMTPHPNTHNWLLGAGQGVKRVEELALPLNSCVQERVGPEPGLCNTVELALVAGPQGSQPKGEVSMVVLAPPLLHHGGLC